MAAAKVCFMVPLFSYLVFVARSWKSRKSQPLRSRRTLCLESETVFEEGLRFAISCGSCSFRVDCQSREMDVLENLVSRDHLSAMRSTTLRRFVYKCTVDDGGAPCSDDGLLTLTICKPNIRRTAKEGDLIFAFGSNNESPANRLVYIAEVSRLVPGGKYFEDDEFKPRQDCIYERVDGRLQQRSNAKFHDDEKARISELGAEPSYPNAIAIVAKDFRYFGKRGMADWKADAPKLCELLDRLQQNHRVNFTPDLLSELVAFKNRIWQDHPHKKVLGTPLQPPDKHIDDDADDIVKVCNSRCYCIPPKQRRPHKNTSSGGCSDEP